VTRFSDLEGRRLGKRQPGAGAAALLDSLMAEAGMRADDISPNSGLAAPVAKRRAFPAAPVPPPLAMARGLSMVDRR
jgi:ABC-type nitrate/sulfonate/bicarbonate transport system substrate-binding protein